MSDRTEEFRQIADLFTSIRGAQEGGQKGSSRANKKTVSDAPKTKTAFNEAAAEIAKGIHRTSGLLNKLTNLVKRQGLFDDPTEEINSFIVRIKQDLGDLNGKCDSAQQYIDGKKQALSSSKNQSSAHSTKVVSQLKADIMHATKDFKTVLEMRSFKMKDTRDKKVALIGKGMLSPIRQIESSLESESRNRKPHGSLNAHSVSSSSGGGGINNNDNNGKKNLSGNGKIGSTDQTATGGKEGGGSTSVVSKPKFASPYQEYDFQYSARESQFSSPQSMQLQAQQQQQQLLLAPIVENQYYESREQAVSEVEKTIGELGQLFKRLATMISEQEELVERIDEDVEAALDNANRAQDVLMKTYEKVSSNRGLFMKLFGILAAFVLFFVIFLM